MDGPKVLRPKAKVTAVARPASPTKPRVRATPSAVSRTQRAATAGVRSPAVAPPSPTPSLHHAASFSAPRPRPAAPPRLAASRSVVGLDRASPTPRIRAKVSTLASPPARSPSPPPPPSPARARAPSSAAAAYQLAHPAAPASGPPPQFYPITTAAPAANPHRFAPPRPASSSGSATPRTSPAVAHPASFQAFRSPRAQPALDPAALTPLPHSPPASTLSASSRSSASLLDADPTFPYTRARAHTRTGSASSSASLNLGQRQHATPTGSSAALRATLDRLVLASSASDDGAPAPPSPSLDPGERKVKAAAKSDRKIADLEITTRSLLAINATLEATAHRQAREIRALRRRLRETRLGLPPRAFRAAEASDKARGLLEVESALSDEDESDTGDEDDDGEGEGEVKDAAYRRVRALLDALLTDGRAALACYAPAPTKVLSPDEMREYHAAPADDDGQAAEDSTREYSGTPDDDDDDDDESDADPAPTTSEEEVTTQLVVRVSASSPPPPPITITQPAESES